MIVAFHRNPAQAGDGPRLSVSGPDEVTASVGGMPGNPLTDPNWATEVTEQITTVVGNVRDKTTDNAVKIVRGLVVAMLALFLGLTAIVLLLIIATRGLQSLLDIWVAWDKAVWLSYFMVGGILTVGGLLLMSRRQSA